MRIILRIKRFWNRLRGRNTKRLIKDLQDYAPKFEAEMKRKYGEYMQPEALQPGKLPEGSYYVDEIRGYEIKLSVDGLIPISELYQN